MRTDVKVGIALGAVVLIVAVSYYGAKKDRTIELSDTSEQVREDNQQLLDSIFPEPPETTGKPKPEQVASRSSQDLKEQPTESEDVDQDNGYKIDPELFESALRSARRPESGGSEKPTTEVASQPQPRADFPALAARDRSESRDPSRTTEQRVVRSPAARDTLRRQGSSVAGRGSRRAGISPHQEKTRVHIIEVGENFSNLAERYYGTERLAGFLVQANPGVDPRRMKVGSEVRIPARPVEPAASLPTPEEPAAGEYRVQKGDTISGIARQLLGAESRWPELFELNRDVVGDNPNVLKAGMILKVPSGGRM